MEFRPCIDIHNGKVKQIVGGSLSDAGDKAQENYVSQQDAAWFADLYRVRHLTGGHVILLNPPSSPYYSRTVEEAQKALSAWPGGLQLGGGVTPQNAAGWLKAGASHVIVTSYVFSGGELRWDRLAELEREVGPEHLVLDVSCRRREDSYYVMTDRWQKWTELAVTVSLLKELEKHCAEFLVHAVDAEGKAGGIEKDLAVLLSGCHGRPVTYAGGIGSLQDVEILRQLSGGTLDFTIGSALDLFGGSIPFEAVAGMM